MDRLPTCLWQTGLQLCTLPVLYILTITIGSYTDAKPSDHIVNPHPFDYHRNNEHLCTNHTDTLIWIHTAPSHYRRRNLLRETWANPINFKKHKVSLVFFLGMSTDDAVQHMIEYESETYGDIVQETFIDSYRNLTYKAIAGCKWTSTFCPSANLIIKADDDMIVDIYLLFRHLDGMRAKGKVISNTIFCDVWYRRAPERKSGKWKVSREEYADDYYPPYCPGLALLMTGDIVAQLYNQSLYEPYFWVDDVYFTGLLAKTLNVTFEQLASTVHFGSSQLIRTDTIFQNQYRFMFYHIQSKHIFRTIWDTLSARESHRVFEGLTSMV